MTTNDYYCGCAEEGIPALYSKCKVHAPIKVGDKVRSYDFDGRRDCYIEGTVRDFEYREGCERYVIEVERVVFADRQVVASGFRGEVYPPVNGTPKLFGGVCNGVEKLAQ